MAKKMWPRKDGSEVFHVRLPKRIVVPLRQYAERENRTLCNTIILFLGKQLGVGK